MSDQPLEARTPTIACDFDGVINSYASDWTGDSLPDPPVPGAIEWLEEITRSCKVIIHTVRLRHGHEGLIADWLLEHGLSEEALAKLTFAEKVRATIYLDDRAIRFTGSNFPTEEEVRNHKKWFEE